MKKGLSSWESTQDNIQAIFYIGLTAVAIFFMAWFVNKANTDNIFPSEEVDRQITFEAAKNCFLYKKDGRVYYNVIDTSEDFFTNENLKNCVGDDHVIIRIIDPGGNKKEVWSDASASFESVKSYKVSIVGSNKIHSMNIGIRE